MHSHLLTISASFSMITFIYKYKYKYFCFPSLTCVLLPPPPSFPAENVTTLCLPSSQGRQWDWWTLQVSKLRSPGAESSLFTLKFPLPGLSSSILHTSTVVGHIVCLLQLMTNMNPWSNCPSLNVFQGFFFFLLKLKGASEVQILVWKTLNFLTHKLCGLNVSPKIHVLEMWSPVSTTVDRCLGGCLDPEPHGWSGFIIIKGWECTVSLTARPHCVMPSRAKGPFRCSPWSQTSHSLEA